MADDDIQGQVTTETDERIRWFGVFTSPAWEARFRNEELPYDVKHVRLVMGMVIIGFLAYIPNDFSFLQGTPGLVWLLAFRVAVVIITLFAMVRVHRGMAPASFDRTVVVWSLTVSASMIAIAYTRPPNFTAHTIVNVLSVALTYLVLPVPISLRAVAAWFLSLGVFALCFWINPPPDRATCLTVFLSLMTANVLGGEIARQLQIWHRRQFFALARQRELSASLERALGEIKTLRGILPICMHCKKIWNDAGFWEQLETYVSEHTHAEFSHGLCPECMRSQYPEIDWDKKRLINPPAVTTGDGDDRPA